MYGVHYLRSILVLFSPYVLFRVSLLTVRVKKLNLGFESFKIKNFFKFG